MKTRRTITIEAFQLLQFLREKMDIKVTPGDIDLKVKSVDGAVSEISLEWVEDDKPSVDYWNR